MRELTIEELDHVGGGSTTSYALGVAGGWAGTVAGYAVSNTLRGAAVGGLAGAGIGFATGVIIGTVAFIAT